MATREEAVRFSLIDNVSKGIVAIQGAVTGISASMVKLNAAAELAKTGLQGISAAGEAFNGLVKGASDSQFQLAGLQAALGATPAEMAKLDAEAKRVSETLGLFSKTEVLDALGGLARAGLSAADSMKALDPVLNLAVGGQTDLQFATDLTVNTLTQFGLSIDKAGQLANGLVAAANASTTNVNAMGLALSYAATTARSAGNSLESTLEILGALAQTGIQADRAGTALRQVFANLADDSTDFSKALRDGYGITTKNLVEIVEALRNSADRGKKALLDLGIEARPAIQGLVDLAVPEFERLKSQIDLTGTAAEDATKKLSETYQAAAGRLVAILTNLRNELALPILQPLNDALSTLAQRVSEFAKTEDFALLKQAIADFATEAGQKLEELVKEFDFKEATENARQAFENLKTSIDDFKKAASLAIDTLTIAFEAFGTAVAALQVFINGVIVVVSEFAQTATAAAIAIAQVTGASEDTIDQLKQLRKQFTEINRERFEGLGESADRLVRSFLKIIETSGTAKFSISDLSSTTTAAASEAKAATVSYEALTEAIAGAKTLADIESARSALGSFARTTGSTADQVNELGLKLAEAEGKFGKISVETVGAASDVKSFDNALSNVDPSNLKDTVTVVGSLGTAAENAAADTKRLAQAFKEANTAGRFEGALDQFKRLKAEGNLTAEQIKTIEAAAAEAGKRFKKTGDEGVDAFKRISNAAQDVTRSVDDVAQKSKRSFEDLFREYDEKQKKNQEREASIQKQIQDQKDAANARLQKEIDLLDRKLNMSREELEIADQLRRQYNLADQERLDRYAQLITRQRELNSEKQEEQRITVGGSSGGYGGGAVGAGSPAAPQPNVPQSTPPTAPPDAGNGNLTALTLARLLAPYLRQVANLGG